MRVLTNTEMLEVAGGCSTGSCSTPANGAYNVTTFTVNGTATFSTTSYAWSGGSGSSGGSGGGCGGGGGGGGGGHGGSSHKHPPGWDKGNKNGWNKGGRC